MSAAWPACNHDRSGIGSMGSGFAKPTTVNRAAWAAARTRADSIGGGLSTAGGISHAVRAPSRPV